MKNTIQLETLSEQELQQIIAQATAQLRVVRGARVTLAETLSITNNTNIELVARSTTLDGDVTLIITKRFRPLTHEHLIDYVYNGSGHLCFEQQNAFFDALVAIERNESERAIDRLCFCGYYWQVELRPLTTIITNESLTEVRPNPLLKTLPPLVWNAIGQEGKRTYV